MRSEFDSTSRLNGLSLPILVGGVMLLWIEKRDGLFVSDDLVAVCLCASLIFLGFGLALRPSYATVALRWSFFFSVAYVNFTFFVSVALEPVSREGDVWFMRTLLGLPFYVGSGLAWANVWRHDSDRLRTNFIVVMLLIMTYLMNVTMMPYHLTKFWLGS